MAARVISSNHFGSNAQIHQGDTNNNTITKHHYHHHSHDHTTNISLSCHGSLTVAASVPGLLIATDEALKLLEDIGAAKKTSKNIIPFACGEIHRLQAALRALQRFIERLKIIHPRRAAMIQVEELVATLTDTIFTFSQFQDVLQLANNGRNLKATYMRAYHVFQMEKRLEKQVAKIQQHTVNLTFILNILQCESDLEASQNQCHLQRSMQELLQQNKKLAGRLHNLEDSFDAFSIVSRRLGLSSEEHQSFRDGDDTSTIRTTRQPLFPEASQSFTGPSTSTLGLAFEDVLYSSWVYRRNEHNECDISIVDTAKRSHAWSVFSGLSLADISILSVIAMPIEPADLTNAKYYNFGPQSEGMLTPDFDTPVDPQQIHRRKRLDHPVLKVNSEPEYQVEVPHQQPSMDSPMGEGEYSETLRKDRQDTQKREDKVKQNQCGREEKALDCSDACYELFFNGIGAYGLGSNRSWKHLYYRCSICVARSDQKTKSQSETLTHLRDYINYRRGYGQQVSVFLASDNMFVCINCSQTCQFCIPLTVGRSLYRCPDCFVCDVCGNHTQQLKFTKLNSLKHCETCFTKAMAANARIHAARRSMIPRCEVRFTTADLQRLSNLVEMKMAGPPAMNLYISNDKSIDDIDVMCGEDDHCKESEAENQLAGEEGIDKEAVPS